MNTFTKSAIAAAALLVSSAASAAPMMLDLTNFGGNYHDSNFFFGGSTIPVTPKDANSKTGVFTEFGFGQLFATSVYDFSDGSLFGSFYDTNIDSELNFIILSAFQQLVWLSLTVLTASVISTN